MSDFVTKEELDDKLKNIQTWVENWFTTTAAKKNLKLPIVIDGYWGLWDYELNRYVKTQFPTKGERGKNGGLFPDAPEDGHTYVRKNGSWIDLTESDPSRLNVEYDEESKTTTISLTNSNGEIPDEMEDSE